MPKKYIDLSTIAGILASFLIIILAISNSKNSFLAFVDIDSIYIVFFSTFFITVACFSLSEVIKAIPIIFNFITRKSQPLNKIAIEALKLAEYAKKNTIMKLEDKLSKDNISSILGKGIILINQNEKIDNIEKILRQEIITYIDEAENVTLIMKKAGEISPAMGLIGTLIGLVQMLGNLSDPANLGPSMAIALLTTFYGAILAYMVFFPIASKIEKVSLNQSVAADIQLKAILSIAKGENPRYLENVINSLLYSSSKISYYK